MYIKVKEADNGDWFYVVTGDNHEAMSTSEMYPTKATARAMANDAYPDAEIRFEDES
jgi:uncharacterized protein YegP (UPF0339 family)